MKIDLTELFKKQAELDRHIALNHNVTYETTREKRTLSLLVEIGEFANSTRCFKYWSNKGPESLDRVLDEYSDALHFFLSLGLDNETNKFIYNTTKHKDNLTSQIMETYHRIDKFVSNRSENNYVRAFQAFLNIIPLLNVRWKTVEKAYLKKLEENHSRQENNY